MTKILWAAAPALLLAACGTPADQEIPVTNTANVVPESQDANVSYRNDEPPEVIEERAANGSDALIADNASVNVN